MNVSIIIATWNNSEILESTLNGFCNWNIPEELSWEIVLVNNNCVDDTDAIVSKYQEILPIQYIKEPRQGASIARNTGLKHSKGELIVFTDDDVICDNDWLVSYWNAYKKFGEGFAYGGPVEGHFVGFNPDPDLIEVSTSCIKGLNYGRENKILEGRRFFIGANWAASRDKLLEVGGFDEDLGKIDVNKKQFTTTGEENNLMDRLRSVGCELMYIPEANVKHLVRKEKCTLEFIANKFEKVGDYYASKQISKLSGPYWGKLPRWMYKHITILWLKYVFKRVTFQKGYKEYIDYRRFKGTFKGVKKILEECQLKHILFLPNWSSENPYQNLLTGGLNQSNTNVVIGDYGWYFPRLLRSALAYPQQRIIHLHWIAPYIFWIIRDKNSLRRNLKIFLTWLDLTLVKCLGRKIFWTVHNIYVHDSASQEVEKKLRKLLFKKTDCAIVHAQAAKDEVINEYEIKVKDREKIHIVEHGNYCGVYPNTVSRSQAREKLGIDESKNVYLIIGAVKPYKGIEEAITAFKKSLSGSNSLLLIAGKPQDDDIKRNIEELIDGCPDIQFYPYFIDDNEIQVFMNASDVCVFPFRKILTSGSVILAMSFAKAVIVPSQGCLTDLVDESGAVLFEDQLKLGESFKAIAQKDLELMGKNNLKIIEKYSWDFVGSKLAGLYRDYA